MSHALGHPHIHHRLTGSTNERARELANAGAPHGTLVTAAQQSAGRGRQGRTWTAPAGRALLMSVLLREPHRLLPLAAAVAVADAIGAPAAIKWPNDILIEGRKAAGILVEGRPQEQWWVLGIGVNVALRPQDSPPDLEGVATGLGLEPHDVPLVLGRVLRALERRLPAPEGQVLEAWRARDALLGKAVRWAGGEGVGAGVDGDGRLVVELSGGGRTELDAGEVHLLRR